MYPFAIDLGTSNTVAVIRGADGRIRPLLFDGREQLPSAVYAGADGALVAGTDAERLARADPAAFEPNPKRRIDDGTVLLGSHPVAVPEALAAVLRAVAKQVDQRGPAVLTVPSTWAAPRRAVLIEAAERAGLGAVTLVSEPVAAAAYYAKGQDGALLVVDVGAGTADIALVRAGAVIAEQGLDVGGLDVDAALVGVLGRLVSTEDPEAWRRLTAPQTNAERRDRLVLWQEVRAAKESLSRLSVAPVHVPGYPADLHLTREELDAAATPLLAPIADVAAEMVAGHELAGVFLVGGGSRMPLLARLLHARLGVAPSVAERPETVVAEGALPAVPDVPAPTKRVRRRWLNPATLILALLCFVLPFATVSCGLPDGYGHAKPGGTTEYNGLDLALGGQPDVQPDQQRPTDEWREDKIEPQPLYVTALIVLVAALVLTRHRRRRELVAGLAALAGLSLVAGQALVVDRLADRIREQSAVPAGKDALDFVGIGVGFWLTMAILVLLVVGNLVGLLAKRRRPDR